MRKKLLIAACSFACFYNSSAQIQLVSTLAGQTTTGAVNGTGTAASFNTPAGMCVDLSGNIYVADKNNHIIRKITPAGVVTTLAGSGATGSVNATGTAASFWYPSDVCADGSGNVYVCDNYNNKIRKITPAGVVTDYAGSGNPGAADGPSLSATFVNPSGIGIDISGNIYVADYSNQRIRKISTSGVVSTIAGSGAIGMANATGTLATFNYPTDVCADILGNLYVSDVNNHCIRYITPAGVVTTFAGTIGSSGYLDATTGTSAKFDSPYNLCADNQGNILVADFSNHKVRKITSAGVVTTVAGLGNGYLDGNNTVALFSRPSGVAAYTGGLVYVSDRDNNIIRKIEPCTAPSAPSAPDATVCAGSSATLTASGTGTISWFMASTGGTAVSVGSVAVTPASLTVGTYTLYLESATDCTTSISRTPVVITVSNCCVAPPAPVNTTPTGYNIPIGTTGTLTATSSGTVNWYTAPTGGAAIATGTAFVISPTAPGSYYAEAVTCTTSATRTEISYQTNTIIDGIADVENNTNAIRLYPNPTTGVFTVESAAGMPKTIEVVDITGRTVLTNISSDAKAQINLNTFAAGIYYVKVKSGKAVNVVKVVKQ